MHKLIGLGMRVAAIGSIGLFASNIAYAQIEGAVQYPPPSVGEDAQPPPPAGMVPQTVSPRRIELGASGSSRLPTDSAYRVGPRTGIDPFSMQPAPLPVATPIPPPSAAGN